MQLADDGLPLVGQTARTLGARPNVDLMVDGHGIVRPGAGGLSVSPNNPMHLPPHRRPPQFGGMGRDPVWQLWTGDLGEELAYRPDPRNPSGHGFIEPTRQMGFTAYQAALEATRERWHLVPGLPDQTSEAG